MEKSKKMNTFANDMNQLWREATEVGVAVNSKTDSGFVYKGIKIVDNGEEVKILDTHNNYKEIMCIKLFQIYGFKKAVEMKCGQRYKRIINRLNYKIRTEVNKKTNNKKYMSYKKKRKVYIGKFVNLNL